MSYGLNLKNKNNEIMFSTDFTAFHFVGKYTATGSPPSYRCQVTFTCNGVPLVFVDGANGLNRAGILTVTDNGGGSFTAVVGGRNAGSQLTSIDIYVFAFPNAATNSGYGMWAKNSSGATTFNFNQKVLKISASHVTTAASSTSSVSVPNQSVTFGTIPENYIVCSAVLGEIAYPDDPTSTLTGIFPYRVNATTVGFIDGTVYATLVGSVIGYTLSGQQYFMFADKMLYL